MARLNTTIVYSSKKPDTSKSTASGSASASKNKSKGKGKNESKGKGKEHSKPEVPDNDEDRQWSIAKISEFRRAAETTEANQGYEYLVHWVEPGYDPSWIPTCDITSAAIHAFWIDHCGLAEAIENGEEDSHPADTSKKSDKKALGSVDDDKAEEDPYAI
ncbi:hypothetical protein F4782DRAFT_551155 [Xylaria castorea]|nr:hypothetical protein F4782DRAFT_551155 [Xylaria castorea]